MSEFFNQKRKFGGSCKIPIYFVEAGCVKLAILLVYLDALIVNGEDNVKI